MTVEGKKAQGGDRAATRLSLKADEASVVTRQRWRLPELRDANVLPVQLVVSVS